MSEISIYTTGNRKGKLELFDDESIDLVVKTKDSRDINKVFSDFVKGFSVPASDRNKYLLNFRYEKNLMPAYSRYVGAIILIDGVEFKSGYLQASELKTNSNGDGYLKLTFFTGLKELKEIIGDDLIADLDFSGHQYKWDENTAVRFLSRADTMTDFGNDSLTMPLVSNTRVWTVGDGSSNDITTSAGAVNVSELERAFKVQDLCTLIVKKYFVDRGLTAPLWLWTNTINYEDVYIFLNLGKENINTNKLLKNSKSFTKTGVDYMSLTYNPSYFGKWINITKNSNFNNISFVKINVDLFGLLDYDTLDRIQNDVTVNIEYQGSSDIQFMSGTPDANGNLSLTINMLNKLMDVTAFRLSISGENNIKYDSFNVDVYAYSIALGTQKLSKTETLTSSEKEYYYNIARGFGDYKVIDFLKGLFSLNNIVVQERINGVDFLTREQAINANPQFEDVSQNVSNLIDYNEVIKREQPAYKTFSFSFKESKYFRNVAYRSVAGKEFGSEVFETGDQYSKEVYEVEVEFNVLPYFVMTGTTNLVTSYLFETNGTRSKGSVPTLICVGYSRHYVRDDNNLPISLYFRSGSVANFFQWYSRPSNASGNYAITFDRTVDVETGIPAQNTLFDYYKKDVGNITDESVFFHDFNINVEPSVFLTLNANKNILIRGEKHLIEEINVNLKNGKGRMTTFNNKKY